MCIYATESAWTPGDPVNASRPQCPVNSPALLLWTHA